MKKGKCFGLVKPDKRTENKDISFLFSLTLFCKVGCFETCAFIYNFSNLNYSNGTHQSCQWLHEWWAAMLWCCCLSIKDKLKEDTLHVSVQFSCMVCTFDVCEMAQSFARFFLCYFVTCSHSFKCFYVQNNTHLIFIFLNQAQCCGRRSVWIKTKNKNITTWSVWVLHWCLKWSNLSRKLSKKNKK